MEWLAEVGLVFTSSTPRLRSNPIALAPSEENLEHLRIAAETLGVLRLEKEDDTADETEINDPEHYAAIATDGSFSIPSLPLSSVLEANSSIREAGTGGSAVVWFPSGANWRQKTFKILQIRSRDSLQPGMTAYAYELLGIAAGLMLSSQIPYYVPLLSDC